MFTQIVTCEVIRKTDETDDNQVVVSYYSKDGALLAVNDPRTVKERDGLIRERDELDRGRDELIRDEKRMKQEIDSLRSRLGFREEASSTWQVRAEECMKRCDRLVATAKRLRAKQPRRKKK